MSLRFRLDRLVQQKGLANSRSQAENLIKLGFINVNGETVLKSGQLVNADAKLKLTEINYVSRAAFKLKFALKPLSINFHNKVVLDVGSSTGGFTDVALKNKAKKVIAVDVGTDQMTANLRNDSRVELHEQTDIRDIKKLSETPDIVLIDVSFISLKEVLPCLKNLITKKTEIIAMAKPQFETNESKLKHHGVIKNERIRREVLKQLEEWLKNNFLLENKIDSIIEGEKGNIERFYKLKLL